MDKIQDYRCEYADAVVDINRAARRYGLPFPDIYLYADAMVRLANIICDQQNSSLCEMPFCHTVEAEALGGKVTPGDERAGPRAKEYLTSDIRDIAELPAIDFSKGRIREVLLACQTLQNQGRHVVLDISGPFTVMDALIEPRHIYRCLRKDPPLAKKVMERLGEEALCYAKEALKYGIKMISYADSSAGVNILGPKMAVQVAKDFTCGFLEELVSITKGRALVVLCPKTTLALSGIKKAYLRDFQLSREMSYAEGCIETVGKIAMSGETCLKRKDYILKDGIIKEVVLI